MAIGNRIKKDFERPAKELVERFKGMPVANIDDTVNRLACMDSGIKALGNPHLVGTAFTIKVPAGDNLMLHAAMDMAKPGDVIVIDAGGYTNRAIFGELMATYMMKRGIAGVICDGAIRDKDEMAAFENFPVFARAAIPNGPYKNGPGEINFPISCGGIIVRPGDIIVADGDGIIVIDPADAEARAEATEKVEAYEADIMKHIVEECSYVRPWVDKKLEETGCEIIE